MTPLDILFERNKLNYLNSVKDRYKNNDKFDWDIEWRFEKANTYSFTVFRKKIFKRKLNNNWEFVPSYTWTYKCPFVEIEQCYVCKKYGSKKFITWGYLTNVMSLLNNNKSFAISNGMDYLCHKCNRFYKKQYDKLKILDEARLQINRITRKQSELKKEQNDNTSKNI